MEQILTMLRKIAFWIFFTFLCNINGIPLSFFYIYPFFFFYNIFSIFYFIVGCLYSLINHRELVIQNLMLRQDLLSVLRKWDSKLAPPLPSAMPSRPSFLLQSEGPKKGTPEAIRFRTMSVPPPVSPDLPLPPPPIISIIPFLLLSNYLSIFSSLLYLFVLMLCS